MSSNETNNATSMNSNGKRGGQRGNKSHNRHLMTQNIKLKKKINNCHFYIETNK